MTDDDIDLMLRGRCQRAPGKYGTTRIPGDLQTGRAFQGESVRSLHAPRHRLWSDRNSAGVSAVVPLSRPGIDVSQFAGDQPPLEAMRPPESGGRELIEGCQGHSLVLDVVEDASPYIVGPGEAVVRARTVCAEASYSDHQMGQRSSLSEIRFFLAPPRKWVSNLAAFTVRARRRSSLQVRRKSL